MMSRAALSGPIAALIIWVVMPVTSADAQIRLIRDIPGMRLVDACEEQGVGDATHHPYAVSDLPAASSNRSELECNRVQFYGQLRWIPEGTAGLYTDLLQAYTAWDFNGTMPRVYLADWPQDVPALYEFNASTVTLEGVLVNVCALARSAASSDNPPDFLQFMDPAALEDLCRGFPLHGYMLFDVELVERHSDPGQRIRGEMNRGVVGDLVRADLSLPPYDQIADATRAWASRLGRGEAQYLQSLGRALSREERNALREQPFLPSDLYGDFNVMQARSGRSLADQPIAVFQYGNGDIADPTLAPFIVGCVCLDETCDDAWPLDRVDLPWMPGSFVCTPGFNFNFETRAWGIRQ
ncbi:hypothetical protein [Maricaulis sp.]|uniref:hypothetical protein n=1 Tax=Maricaulis sp. TaxID=1486257 RepID=UPI0025C207BA|nr:hypothetical protein [Maricaulis sp.]